MGIKRTNIISVQMFISRENNTFYFREPKMIDKAKSINNVHFTKLNGFFKSI